MAKKKPPPVRQQRIPGTIDAPTEKALRKAEEYVQTLQQRMSLQVDENAFRVELIEVMKDGGIETFALDGYTVTLVHAESDKIAIRKADADVNQPS